MPSTVKRFALNWLPLILFCLVIYIQSANPSPGQIPSIPFIDKVLHFIAYGIMGILFYRAYRTLRVGENMRLLILLSVVSATLYGISDEYHQSFVPFREADVMDVVADFFGSACGVFLYHFWIISSKDERRSSGLEGNTVEVGGSRSSKLKAQSK